MSTEERTASPAGALAAMAVERCIEVLDEKLGPLEEGQRHVLALDLAQVVGRLIQRDVQRLLTGAMH
jgi:hypothetical protein